MIAALIVGAAFAALVSASDAPERTIRVATYNLRNYLSMDRLVDGQYRLDYPKPESEKSVVRSTIRAVDPDLLAVQEIGSLAYLKELRDDLAKEGLVYEGIAIVDAADEDRHVAALWKGELSVEAVARTDMTFRYFGERIPMKRGLLELRLLDGEGAARASVFVAHLKSRYTSDKRDPESRKRRTLEAQAARERILDLFPDPKSARYMIVGDLNDVLRSAPLRRFQRKGARTLSVLLDARDANGQTWTHEYRKEGVYSQIDHILVSPGWTEMAGKSATIVSRPDFYEGSDHRLVWVDVVLP